MATLQNTGGELTRPLHLLRIILPLAMVVVLLAAGASVVRLALSLGEPFPGFAMMWRKEEKLFAVGHLTPIQYPGLLAGMEIGSGSELTDSIKSLNIVTEDEKPQHKFVEVIRLREGKRFTNES
ncbi:MAG: hypothetical protein J5I90_08910, partial [Caldilineales bacterium]|nr:hypothetical protein [Caldilineales bacterium]